MIFLCNEMRGFLIFFAVFAFFIPVASAAIMVSPGSYSVDFVPGLQATYHFDFFVDDNALLQVYSGGDLAKYVKLSTTSIRGRGGVDVSLSLPKSIDPPGTHSIIIGARQSPEPGTQGFGLLGNIIGQIQVVIPYPGQYLSFDFAAKNANAGEPITFSGSLNNLGEEDVPASVTVDVYLNDTKVREVNVGDFRINSSDKMTFSQNMETTGLVSGNYFAIASLIYGDNHLVQKNASFRLGELKVNLANYTSVFERNKINKIELQVESRWNDDIPAVYANVSLVGYPIHFVTPTIALGGFGTDTLTGFFDTTGLNDSFDADISLNYAGKSDTQRVHLSMQNQTNYLSIILIGAIVIVIAAIVIVTFFLRKRKKGKRR